MDHLVGTEPLCMPAAVRARDQAAIAAGIPGYTLMTRAAEAALSSLRQRWSEARHLLIFCGGGNNGGDGLVLARLAHEAGLKPQVRLVADPSALKGDAARALRDLGPVEVRSGRTSLESLAQDLEHCDLIVDGIFGTGLSRSVAGPHAVLIESVNDCSLPVLALDVPSGLCSATGAVLGHAVRADLTVTFVERKIGHYLGRAQDFVGDLELARLAIDRELEHEAPHAVARLLQPALLGAVLPPRSRVAHKGRHGHVLVIGGAPGMGGAARLAAEAALHAGAGLVSVATAPTHAAWLGVGRPELMTRAVQGASDLDASLARATLVVVGPGLGVDPWAVELLGRALASPLPLVIDADGLSVLVKERWLQTLGDRSAPVVLTPHPGEAARLLGLADAGTVQRDRLRALDTLVARCGQTVVLKGAGSLIGAPGKQTHLCDRGNPGMAVAGMGDVLAGVIGALLAQTLDHGEPFAAACAGVLAHAMAGDDAVLELGGQLGLLAGDLAPFIRSCLNGATRS